MKLNIRLLIFILILAIISILLSTSLYISTIEIIGFMSVGVVLSIILSRRSWVVLYNIILVMLLQAADASLEYVLAMRGQPKDIIPSFYKYMAEYYEGGILIGTVLLTLIVTICIVDMVKKLEERDKSKEF